MIGVVLWMFAAALTPAQEDPSWIVFHHAGPGAAIIKPDRLRIVSDVTHHGQLWQLPDPKKNVGAEVVFRVANGVYPVQVVVYYGGCIDDGTTWVVPKSGTHHVVSEGDCWVVDK